MNDGPLDRLDEWLPPSVRRIVDRETPIPTIALAAREKQAAHPDLVRGDIGQIVGVDPEREVLYAPPVGMSELREALAETWNRAFGLDGGGMESAPDGLRPENVTVCTGAAEGLSLLFRCFGTGRVVGLPRGHWENYRNGVELSDGKPVVVDLFDDEGRLDADALERRIRDEGIELLVTNFPCNPTGAVLDERETRQLAAVAQRTGIVMIADEVYARLRYDGVRPQTLLRHAPGHVVTVSSASKEYLLPGARVGYVLCARSRLTDRVLRRLVRANTASPNVLGQERLLESLREDLADLRAGREPALLVRIRDAMARRLERLVAVLGRHEMTPFGRPGHAPQGTIFLMTSLPPWFSGDDSEFAHRSLAAGCVSCIPGRSFGLPGAVRFSFGAMTLDDIDRLDVNLGRFRAACQEASTPTG